MENSQAGQSSPHQPFTPDAALLSDAVFLADLRVQMHRFATLQLSNADLAEDVVQEALVGALKSAKAFGGKSALKTWVFAILKNKIADALRKKKHLATYIPANNEDEEDFSELFNRKGFWQVDERPVAWGNPEESLRAEQFWRVFEACLDNLPGHQARVFMMREFIELDTDEICVAAGISVTNLNVMLHRSRLRLRECLENRWFIKGEH